MLFLLCNRGKDLLLRVGLDSKITKLQLMNCWQIIRFWPAKVSSAQEQEPEAV